MEERGSAKNWLHKYKIQTIITFIKYLIKENANAVREARKKEGDETGE